MMQEEMFHVARRELTPMHRCFSCHPESERRVVLTHFAVCDNSNFGLLVLAYFRSASNAMHLFAEDRPPYC
jgi:hypothetical protein